MINDIYVYLGKRFQLPFLFLLQYSDKIIQRLYYPDDKPQQNQIYVLNEVFELDFVNLISGFWYTLLFSKIVISLVEFQI